MVQSKRRLLYIREKSRSHKTKNPLFHLVPCHEMLIIIFNCSHIRNIIMYFLNNKIEMGSSKYLPLLRSMDSLGQTVLLKSEKFEMDLGRLATASEVAEYLTILKRAWSADSKMVRLVLL
jgi:hypothetical protein